MRTHLKIFILLSPLALMGAKCDHAPVARETPSPSDFVATNEPPNSPERVEVDDSEPSPPRRPQPPATPDERTPPVAAQDADRCEKIMTPSECIVFNEANRARRANGVPPLRPHLACAKVARDRAQQYTRAGKGILDTQPHVTPNGEHFSRIGFKFGYNFSTVERGENLAQRRDPREVVYSNQVSRGKRLGWINSPGHRQNLLNPRFTHMGIGHSGNIWAQCLVAEPSMTRVARRGPVQSSR